MERWDSGAFCRAYLRTMDPERAAAETGRGDGFSLLGGKAVQARLERMRTDAAGQLRREDAVRRLAAAVSERCGGVAAVFSPGSGGTSYALCRPGGDLRPLCRALNAALDGRGGGKPELVQGSVRAGEDEIRNY